MSTPEKDAEALRNAMKGAGTDENAIIKLVANRTNAQRQKIKLFYKSSYGRDLVEDLKKELSGNFEDAVIALFYDPVEYDCYQLRKAMKGLGTDKDSLCLFFKETEVRTLILIKKNVQRTRKNYMKQEKITGEQMKVCSIRFSVLDLHWNLLQYVKHITNKQVILSYRLLIKNSQETQRSF